MTSITFINKPQVSILSPPLFLHPARNYMASILAADIAAAKPRRVLDAGAGELRTYPLFPPGTYTGLVLDPSEIVAGLKRHAKLIKKNGRPSFVVTDLNADFQFLSTFDVIVCTGTAPLLESGVDVLRRLSDHVEPGGIMLLEVPVSMLEPLFHSVVADHFDRVEVVALDTLGLPPYPKCMETLGLQENKVIAGRDMVVSPQDIERLRQFAVDEMNAEARIENAVSAYVRCLGRRRANH